MEIASLSGGLSVTFVRPGEYFENKVSTNSLFRDKRLYCDNDLFEVTANPDHASRGTLGMWLTFSERR